MLNILTDAPLCERGLERLRAIDGVNVEVVREYGDDGPRPMPSGLISDKQVLFCQYPPENFADMESLQLIQLASAGYSQLFGLGLAERGIRACNGRGVQDIPIAEWSISMMVNLIRDLRSMIRNQDKVLWDRDSRFQREVRGSVVGIWGYGGLGRETARLAKTMGMVVHALDAMPIGPRPNDYRVPGTGDPEGILADRKFVRGEEKDFLSGLDFLILTVPLTKRTEGIVGEDELRALPKTAYLLNPARGPLVKEQALIRALQEGWISGAALDTHYYYPMPPEHPLWRFPNVIMTPHISGSSLSTHAAERNWDIFVQNVERFLAGEPLLNELSPAQLDGE